MQQAYAEENPFKAEFVIKTKDKSIVEELRMIEGVENATVNTIDNPYLWYIGQQLK